MRFSPQKHAKNWALNWFESAENWTVSTCFLRKITPLHHWMQSLHISICNALQSRSTRLFNKTYTPQDIKHPSECYSVACEPSVLAKRSMRCLTIFAVLAWWQGDVDDSMIRWLENACHLSWPEWTSATGVEGWHQAFPLKFKIPLGFFCDKVTLFRHDSGTRGHLLHVPEESNSSVISKWYRFMSYCYTFFCQTWI